MKRFISSIILVFIILSLNAQAFKIGVETGIGSYRMSDLKSFQEEMISAIPELAIKNVEDFPPSVFYSVYLDYELSKTDILSINASYYSTGARNHIADYSGEYKLDMLSNAYKCALSYKNLMPVNEKLSFYWQLESGLIFSKLELNELLKIGNQDINNQSYDFRSIGFMGKPSIGLTYPLIHKLFCNLCLGYEYNLPASLHIKGNKDAELTNYSGDNVRTDWSGIRMSFGLYYTL